MKENGAKVFANYSDIQGGFAGGVGNINADPLFLSRQGYDYLIGPGSPCIDAGDPALADGVWDSNPLWPRGLPDGPRSDMGAYGGPQNFGWIQ